MSTPVAYNCRIVVWSGASLWSFDVAPWDRVARPPRLHAHHAIQLTFAVDGRFGFRTEHGRVEGPLVLIAPDLPHAFEPEGRYVLLFVEPESRPGAALMGALDGAPIRSLDPSCLGDAPVRLARIWAEPKLADLEIEALGRDLLGRLTGPEAPTPPIDPRVARVVAWAEPRIEEPLSLPQAAAVACLSETRFSHLFVEETGQPFRTWLLWRRLMRAVERRAAGVSLTEAAHQAGFSDSAHLSRTFLRMFGVQPSTLVLV